MTARLLLRALWRQRVVALVLLLLTLGSTALYLRTAERAYTATAAVAIVPGPVQAGFGELSGPLLGTLVDLARSNDVLEAARTAALSAGTEPPPLEAFRGATEVQAVRDAFTLRISVTLSDSALAAEMANRIASALPRYNLVPERVSYRAVEVARPPTSPSAPQSRLVLAVGSLLGLALAVAGALVVDDARRRVEEPDELAQVVGAPLLGHLVRPRDAQALVSADDELGQAGLRSVRIGLGPEIRGALVVAGVGEGDDDRWLASNTAVGLAAIHRRVLLVLASPYADGPDMTKEPEGRGLSEALRGEGFAPLLRAGPVKGLSVLLPGKDPDALPTLIESGFETLAQKLSTEFDVVVVDAPPLALSDDARILARQGQLLLWNRLGRVAQRDAHVLVRDLRASRIDVAGCVAVESTPRLPSLLRRLRR